MSQVAKRNPVGWLKSLHGGTLPQVLLLAQDLPDLLTTASWTNRGSAANAVGVTTPRVSKTGWPGGGIVGGLAANLRLQAYFTANDDAPNYGASTAFTWVFAGIIRNTAAQRNLIFLGSSSSGVNFKGLYVTAADAIGVVSNRNGTTTGGTTTGSTVAMDVPCIIGVSCAADGTLLIKQLTSAGETTLLSTTHGITGTLTVDRLSVGCALLNGTPGSLSDCYVRAISLCRGYAASSSRLSEILVHFRNNLGCGFDVASESPAGSGTDLISLTNATRLYDASLQTSVFPTVNDLTGNGNGTAFTATHTKTYFDFANNAAASITTDYVLPAGTSSFTMAATVRLVSGRSWSSGPIYNIFGCTALGFTLLVHNGELKAHYNGTLYTTGVNVVSTWVAGKRYAVAAVWDGTNLKIYINNMLTPVSTHAPSASRGSASTMIVGSSNGAANGWCHLIKNWAIFERALSSSDLVAHFRGLAAHSYRITLEGDSNSAQSSYDYIAPAGWMGIWNQATRYVFPRAKLRTSLFLNLANSGRAYTDVGSLAPVTGVANGVNLDAGNDADYDNIAIVALGTNDTHSYARSSATTLANATTWYNDRVASGKYRKVGAMQIPPSTNATFNSTINAINAGLAGIFDFVITRHADLGDPADGIHWLAKANANDAEHYNPLACRKQAEQIRDAILNGVIPYYD